MIFIISKLLFVLLDCEIISIIFTISQFLVVRQCFLFQLEHFFNQLEENGGDKVLNIKQFKVRLIELHRNFILKIATTQFRFPWSENLGKCQEMMKTEEKWNVSNDTNVISGFDASDWGKRMEKVFGQRGRGIFKCD